MPYIQLQITPKKQHALVGAQLLGDRSSKPNSEPISQLRRRRKTPIAKKFRSNKRAPVGAQLLGEADSKANSGPISQLKRRRKTQTRKSCAPTRYSLQQTKLWLAVLLIFTGFGQ